SYTTYAKNWDDPAEPAAGPGGQDISLRKKSEVIGPFGVEAAPNGDEKGYFDTIKASDPATMHWIEKIDLFSGYGDFKMVQMMPTTIWTYELNDVIGFKVKHSFEEGNSGKQSQVLQIGCEKNMSANPIVFGDYEYIGDVYYRKINQREYNDRQNNYWFTATLGIAALRFDIYSLDRKGNPRSVVWDANDVRSARVNSSDIDVDSLGVYSDWIRIKTDVENGTRAIVGFFGIATNIKNRTKYDEREYEVPAITKFGVIDTPVGCAFHHKEIGQDKFDKIKNLGIVKFDDGKKVAKCP
ncbi:MAG: hypothetical protein HQK54_15770, partial [Oligoflexales bacterium]|nr:hypothetical protein [Oligoflexales bacterium]